MAENDKIKVVGYAQRVFYNDGIEYRNFTPDLVGNQFVSNGDTALFTYGNFAVLKNTSVKDNLSYPTKPFSNFFTLNDIGGSSPQVINTVFSADITVKLNIDSTEIINFAYFGSATEFIRVTLESIITKWPAAIFVRPLDNDTYDSVYTVENYSYSTYFNTSTFKIKNNGFVNNYDVIYNIGGAQLASYNSETKSLITNYVDYVILYNNVEYPIIEFTGSTNLYNDYIQVRVNGNPFPDALLGPLYETYHIKPNNTKAEEFFMGLSPFENILLNRLTLPKYKATFNYQFFTDEGLIYDTSEDVTWPTSDGYNLDFNTNQYVDYVSKLLNITNSLDETRTDLMVRFLVAESISNFDTVPRCDGTEEETAGQKMTKTLRIYGREFDEIKLYIDGLAYSNHVTYDKKNNAPDQVIKYIARVMGWQLTSSILETDLVKAYLDAPAPTYSGYTRGLTAAEAELELWRRLILNSAWLFKSKGTRKAVEFLFKFIGAPEGLINLNEYVYVAKNKIDTNIFTNLLEEYGYSTIYDYYNLDLYGFPKPLPDNPDMYFQKGGLWYRETGGSNASEYITEGNNPHIGPYDGGAEYINQFRNLLPNFQPTVLTSSTFTYTTTELFTNYNNGIVNNYSGDTYVDVETWSGVTLEDCFLYEAHIIHDPHPTAEQTDCGCDVPADDLSLYIGIKRDEYSESEQLADCSIRISGYTYVSSTSIDFYNTPYIYNWNYLTYNVDGTLSNEYYVSPYISPTCCRLIVGGLSYLHDEYVINADTGKPQLINSGYVCCQKPALTTTPTSPVESFKDFGYDIKTNAKSKLDIGPVKPFDTTTPEQVQNGCGCYLACNWRLAGPLLGNMYTYNDNMYLKFVTPKNNWGQSGVPEYRVSVESDSCFCPPKITIPEAITDPYTNKMGYGCKLTEDGKQQLTLSQNTTFGTVSGPLYQLFYQKSVGEISCTSFSLENICNITVGSIPPIAYVDGYFQIQPPTVSGNNGPVTYLWQITKQTGIFSTYGFLNSPNELVPQIGPLNNAVPASGAGEFEITLFVSDSPTCRSSSSGKYIISKGTKN
jgi:hypothetical protein